MSTYEEDIGFQPFDEEETYHPVFCVARVPDEFFDEFNHYASRHETPWLEITTSNPANILDELRKPDLDESSSEPSFLGWDLSRVYEFWASHVRPASGSTGRQEHFTAFTFIVLDESCIHDRQMILCSDAPDFGEAEHEVKLKTMRMSFREGLACLTALEQLSMTPSESQNPGKEPLRVSPMPTMQAVAKDPGDAWPGSLYRIATPSEARANKRRGIMAAERGQ